MNIKFLGKYLFLLLVVVACKTIKISKFDHYSFEKTNELKVKTHQLIVSSKDSYTVHLAEIEVLLQQLSVQYSYEKNRANNDVSIAMWDGLYKKEDSMILSYLASWKKKDKMNIVMTEEASKQTDEAFDKIIELESKKEK